MVMSKGIGGISELSGALSSLVRGGVWLSIILTETDGGASS